MWRLIVFGVVMVLVWGGAHGYVGWSLTRHGDPSRAWKVAVWSLLGANVVISIAAMAGRRLSPDQPFVESLQSVAFVGMGAFVLLLTMVVLRDVIEYAARWAARFQDAVASAPHPTEAENPKRRELFAQVVNSSMVGAAALGAAYGYREATKIPEVEEIDVAVDGLHSDLDGFRLVQFTDTHIGPTLKGDFLEAVVDRINALDADLVAMTGDLADGWVERMRDQTESIARLRARHGAYFVTGNHEYYWEPEAWCREVERCGVGVLNNANEVVEHGSARLAVAGVTDYSAARHKPEHATDPHKAMRGAEEADFKLLLAHQPKSVHEASKAGFDLQISGHTHGGQFWPWSLFVGLAHPFKAGLHDYEEMKIYVSRGTGYWGPPLRIGVPNEITLLTLRSV